MIEVDATAIVDSTVLLGEDCYVGPYAIIEKGVTLGRGSHIAGHAIIRAYSTLGIDCQVDSFAVVGGSPQHLKYSGEQTSVQIGDGVTLREYVTVHRGTEQGRGRTTISDNTYVMAYTHIAHDCEIGSGVILANAIQLAGHVEVGDMSVVGGHSAIAQFCRIGAHCYIGGGTVIRKDVPPFVTGKGSDIQIHGINAVGLARRGFTKEAIRGLKDVFRIFYMQNLTTAQALEKATAVTSCPEVEQFIEFFRSSKLGVTR